MIGTTSLTEFLSPAVRDMQPSGIRRYFDYAAGRKDIISLGVGEPDFVTPKPVRDACIAALEKGRTSYTPNAGLPELREAIADYLAGSFGMAYDPADEVLVTNGSSEAIDLALRALITPGDEILIPEPCFIAYSPIAALFGGVNVPIETKAENGFKLTADALREKLTPRSKILMVSYPSNPTGGIMTREDWLPIAKLAEEHNLVIITDEIYAELTYGRVHESLAALPGMKERTLLVSGFSKAFAMTGWRVGYTCGPSELVSAMLKIHQYTAMCAPIIGQIAALESLVNGLEEKDRMVESYDKRRQFFVAGLRKIGLPCHEPLGSFYAFPSIARTGLSSDEFATRLLDEVGVVAVPGHVFGVGGEGFIRCCYAAAQSQLEEALERIDTFVQTL
ncbi:aminotransferase class I/II-fold pyridoxal phosphate-dependent enzyme [Paenibacillus rhizovicinus]|uniref:Aminotransferase n=1 Tax=Paenibacillus rhizovicinus TaxID=2704463 RepID=A0A6C0NUM1_9BACL|nr:aminotransferase class I/II-fold pyridoxal phosphate-dependent enzyme [Paenibacillus rhizovicinus]QHW29885.1 aminotransferase class I/II-fold pyridoxal phosphate-dependent enzyme [Paenibacillus rhizovicinus]